MESDCACGCAVVGTQTQLLQGGLHRSGAGLTRYMYCSYSGYGFPLTTVPCMLTRFRECCCSLSYLAGSVKATSEATSCVEMATTPVLAQHAPPTAPTTHSSFLKLTPSQYAESPDDAIPPRLRLHAPHHAPLTPASGSSRSGRTYPRTGSRRRPGTRPRRSSP